MSWTAISHPSNAWDFHSCQILHTRANGTVFQIIAFLCSQSTSPTSQQFLHSIRLHDTKKRKQTTKHLLQHSSKWFSLTSIFAHTILWLCFSSFNYQLSRFYLMLPSMWKCNSRQFFHLSDTLKCWKGVFLCKSVWLVRWNWVYLIKTEQKKLLLSSYFVSGFYLSLHPSLLCNVNHCFL